MNSNLSYKNKQSSVYVDLTKTDGKYNVYVYDFILLRDVFIKQGMNRNEALKVFHECREKHNCNIEV
mgnify:CR=1 FL=1